MTQSTVDQVFIEMFQAEVFNAYQRMGTHLSDHCQKKGGVKGEKTWFPHYGRATATQKPRHGKVPRQNPEQRRVDCVLSDWYAAITIDKLDELKTNVEQRQTAANAGAWALGRRTDEIIIEALVAAGPDLVGTAADGLTYANVLRISETFNGRDIPFGERCMVISERQYTDLMALPQFTSDDFVSGKPIDAGAKPVFNWMGITWVMFTGLPKTGANRHCFGWHKPAVGIASGLEVTTEINYLPEEVAHLANNYMSLGAVVVDKTGAIQFNAAEA